jgi:hypothetical protein
MRCHGMIGCGSLLFAAPLAAQDNPFAFTGGGVKTAYIVYDVTSSKQQTTGSRYEIGVAPDRWIMRMVTPLEFAGKKDTLRVWAVTTRDSQYTYNAMGAQPAEAEVNATLRPHLGRAYAALDGAGKARFRENAKLAAQKGGSSDAEAYITLVGQKTGSETIVGHKCDVYKAGKATACVVPGAPMVMLRWSNEKDGVNLMAKKVTLNGPIPSGLGLLPKGAKWKKGPADDADFITNIWELKKQSDPSTVPAATVSQYVVRYLASPGASAELKAMQGGTSEDTPAEEESSDSEAAEDTAGT